MRGEKIKGAEFFCHEKLFVSGWEGKQWAEVKKKRNLSVLAKIFRGDLEEPPKRGIVCQVLHGLGGKTIFKEAMGMRGKGFNKRKNECHNRTKIKRNL